MGFIFLFRINNERERREILRRGMFILFLPCHFHTYYVQTVCADSNCSVTVRVGCRLISQVIDDVLDERRVRIGLAIFVHTDSIRIALAERQRIHLGNDLDWHVINAARLYIRTPISLFLTGHVIYKGVEK